MPLPTNLRTLLTTNQRTVKRSKVDDVTKRRNGLAAAIEQQISSVNAEIKGEKYATGKLNKKGKPVAFRAWWWADAAGTFSTEIKYGPAALEFGMGSKNVFTVSALKQLVDVYNNIKREVAAGALDKEIAASAVRTPKKK